VPYLPLLRTKTYDVLAVKEAAGMLAGNGRVVPIFDPVRCSWRRLQEIANAGVRFCLIVNPQVGDFAGVVLPAEFDPVLASPSVVPTFQILRGTTAAQVNAFAARHPAAKAFLYLEVPTANAAAVATAITAAAPTYVVIRRNVVPTLAALGPGVHVDLVDNYNLQARNEDYPPDEFYTNRHLSLPDANFGSFGDYSIVGDIFRERAGPAHAVTLHHIYLAGPRPNDIRIRHYVSVQRGSPGNIQAKWYDALTQLVTDLPNLAALTPLNDTPVCAEYVALHASAAFPQLGPMKKLAIKHGLHVISRAI
jgi:hypothetical protein